ncbi:MULTISPECIES: ferredoxin [unclassified Streptomyces]|uniref:ferredoxin n=1 Tax=unclassified Streptomyces TaxID=2593676 RepID=UPI002E7FEB2D|nr:ferredoxin [Streptomyces sp. NBC_00523]WUD01655.1 ferredoxin [Streptomyces sp. NBC_00523]
MRIDIDKDVCIGAGQCALAAPKVFTQDEDGLSELLPEAAPGPMVAEAVRACPVGAIRTEGARGA